MRGEYESDKETEALLCTAKAESERRGDLVPLGAIVYYNSWIGGFLITGRKLYLLFMKFDVQTKNSILICIFIWSIKPRMCMYV